MWYSINSKGVKRRDLVTTISAVGGVLAVLGYVVKISMDYARVKAEQKILKQEMVEVEQRLEESFTGVKQYYTEQFKEIKKSNSEKFKELYNSRNKTEICLAELTSTIKMLVQNMDKQYSSIEKKIDEISKRIGE